MTIAGSLEKLASDLSDAYDAIENKGGVIPEHKNTDNLPDAITSIEGGGGGDDPGDWGLVEYYADYSVSATATPMRCSVSVVDETKLKAKVTGLLESADSATVNATYSASTQKWTCSQLWSGSISTEDVETLLGIQITDIQTGSVRITIKGTVTYDTTTTTKYLLQSQAEYESLVYQGTPVVRLGGICKFTFGGEVTTIPDGFMRSCQNLEKVDASYADNLTTIGNLCFAYAYNINGKITFANVTSVGNSFMRSCRKITDISMPELVSAGDYFGSGWYMTPSFPKLGTVGTYFMEGCLWDEINLATLAPSIQTIGGYAFANCYTRILRIGTSDTQFPNLQSVGGPFAQNTKALQVVWISAPMFNALVANTSSFTRDSVPARRGAVTVLLNGAVTQSDWVAKFPQDTTNIMNTSYRTWAYNMNS